MPTRMQHTLYAQMAETTNGELVQNLREQGERRLWECCMVEHGVWYLR